LYAEIKGLIQNAGATVFEMGDIDSNPRIKSVEEGARICRSNHIQCVVALGSGSTMDCSKVIAGAAMTDMDPRMYLWGDKVEMKTSLDTVMIPTIADTGTELNNTAVIMDEASVSKSWCGAECMFPNMTIIDPEIHASVPSSLRSGAQWTSSATHSSFISIATRVLYSSFSFLKQLSARRWNAWSRC
jgi:alcohol dehydrogenase YqhD (iron-dependent ADH family)